ncbi:MAG: C39 family peptidase [Chloroflexi bacterium]|nr:C39 family peptidase [Chloroflexota bacterium]MCI0648610.1 C39 family peptidase [Chloroflexota bacterium]MCI0725445.1 C39 family peptidase [Chloroflexota bacterium]
MRKRRYVLLAFFSLVALFVWQLPAILRAIPSRYVAAYLPPQVQALAFREQPETLPTAAAVDATSLLPPQPPAGPATPTLVPSLVTPTNYTPTPLQNNTTTQLQLDTATPALPTNTPIPIPPSARLPVIDHQFQTWNNCGPATLAMTLNYFGLPIGQSQTAAVMKPNPEDRNVSPHEMAAYVNDQTEQAAISRTNGNLDILRRLLAAGVPVIIELGIDPPGAYAWMGWYGHYLLVVAYDDDAQKIWVFDSWLGTSDVPGENADLMGREIEYLVVDQYWQQFNRNYIAVFRPEQRAQVEAIIGPDMDDAAMWQRSLVVAQAEAEAEPENAYAWFNLGSVYNVLGDYERAAAAFDQARAIGLPWRMLWYQFGPYEAYYQVGRYEEVLLLADATLQDRPYFEESFYYKGLALAALGRTGEARDNLQQAVEFNPNFTLAAEALAALNEEGF